MSGGNVHDANKMEPFSLPDAPANCTGAVKAWRQPVVLPTYEPLPPDPNPMFLETRVYQGSSGRVYPLPVIDRIASEPTPRSWQAIHIENEYIRLMILPELGGRIHVGFDKINGYDFFYRQNVIKPALVGLNGPWISGGVEFNWPQHHRPSTFMPVNTHIDTSPDGSVTVWCSDHDPMERMRGTHGVCLYPGRSLIEVKVRLFNRTPLTQTFLWWANVATRVDQNYQSLFPPDVHSVADHARRAVTTFPFCNGTYYGIDYGSRPTQGVPPDQQPSSYQPTGHYAPNDLSRYANIPVPTSYMAIGSEYDFLGGYDHGRNAGVVHVADHHIAPGKKQWTWGNHAFGYAWDRNLTDSDGPYIELMAGAYTDNQPDFSFLTPFETKTFSQFWFPIRNMGGVHQANANAAVFLQPNAGSVEAKVFVTQSYQQAKVRLLGDGDTPIAEWTANLDPSICFQGTVPTQSSALALVVTAQDGSEIIRFDTVTERPTQPISSAKEPALPEDMTSLEELYLTGVHLSQYRHATRLPETYWQEALRREPSNVRCNTAMGNWRLRRGEFTAAEQHLRTAIAKLTQLNGNPPDGEAFYLLGITLRYLGDTEGAYSAFYKATWNYAWIAPGYLALAEIDTGRKRWQKALEHVSRSLAYNAENLNARNIKVILLRKLNRTAEAEQLLAESLALDPLDAWTCYLAGTALSFPGQQLLDLAFDLARLNLFDEAADILRLPDSFPIAQYARASFLEKAGRKENASEVPSTHSFPSRLEEQLVLEQQLDRDPDDSKAHYYLGNLLYDKRRHLEALHHWRTSVTLNPEFPTAWRNIGIGSFNVLHEPHAALEAFERAFKLAPGDARIFFERDQLWKRTRRPLQERLHQLEHFPHLVERRDDLSVELATLYNQTEQPEKALQVLNSRQFQPWEGGEGLALAQHLRAHLALGRRALVEMRPFEAIRLFQAALESPANLSEARHVLANRSNVYYWLGVAHEMAGLQTEARECWQMAATPLSEMSYYTCLALIRLGHIDQGILMATNLASYARNLFRQEPKIDYFATSLPTMLLFHDDLSRRQKLLALTLLAQTYLIQGHYSRAVTLLRGILRRDPCQESAYDALQELPREANVNA